jgi:hypothetical protein
LISVDGNDQVGVLVKRLPYGSGRYQAIGMMRNMDLFGTLQILQSTLRSMEDW